MELRQLRYFVAIVDRGSMGKAALESNVAPAAVSQQITRLERELGVKLLTRSTTGTTPTSAGRAFYRRAQLILRQIDEAVAETRHAELSGQVSVGFTPATAAMLGPRLLEAVKRKLPGIQLHLVEAFSGYLAQQLDARKLDLAIVFSAASGQQWNCSPLLKEGLIAIWSPSAPISLPQFGGIRLQDLIGQPLLLPSRLHGLRRMLDAAFGQLTLVPRIALEIDSLSMLIEAARQGHGIAVQQSSVVAQKAAGGLVSANLLDPGLGLPNFIASLDEQEMTPAARLVKALILELAADLVHAKLWPHAELSIS